MVSTFYRTNVDTNSLRSSDISHMKIPFGLNFLEFEAPY